MPDQPTTAPVAYSDGKGTLNLYCLACPRPPEVTIALTVNDIDHWEQCRACGRYVVDVAREAAANLARACTWPACLTPNQHTELAAQVTAAEHGQHRPAMPDQRAICGCTEATPAPAPVDPALQQRTTQTPDTHPRDRLCDAFFRLIRENQHRSVIAPGVMADTALTELAPELARAQLGDHTKQELADLAVNAANALRDEKRHYAISCQEITRLRELVGRLGSTEQQRRDDLDLERRLHEEHRRALALLLGLPPDTDWPGLTRRITVQQQALAEPQVICPCGLGTRLGCATEKWGCVHDHEQPRDDTPSAPAKDGTP
jgi:hypothetical protein